MGKSKPHLCLILVLCTFSLVLSFLGGTCQQAVAAGQDGTDMRGPVPQYRLTLSERLMMQNAVCVLWRDAALQKSEALQNVNPLTLAIARDIFIDPLDAFYYNSEYDVWIFEGLIRRMAAQDDGIEGISQVQSFHMQVKRHADGSFRIVTLLFEDLAKD